jgi:hypothetical protein
LIIAWKVMKCTDHFVANELRWKMKYLVWEDKFRWRSYNNNSPAMWCRRTSIQHTYSSCHPMPRIIYLPEYGNVAATTSDLCVA